jgi:hypothetical protein
MFIGNSVSEGNNMTSVFMWRVFRLLPDPPIGLAQKLYGNQIYIDVGGLLDIGARKGQIYIPNPI